MAVMRWGHGLERPAPLDFGTDVEIGEQGREPGGLDHRVGRVPAGIDFGCQRDRADFEEPE